MSTLELPATIAERAHALTSEFQALDGWEARYKRLIELGRALGDLPDSLKDEDHKVRGCQSQVWLHAEVDSEGRVQFRGDSDALIVKGLVSILLRVYSGASPAQILAAPPVFLKEMGLDQHLSPSRANGLHAMVKQMMFYATAFAALARMKS